MHIEQKQNRIYRPQSVTTLSAEESNQVTTELENLITAGGLTPSAGTLTQVRDAVQNVVNVAKNNLQEQIDAITSASDVFDVVGTYDELQAYDTSTVPINDIIKVLQDRTHNNAATYYRLEEESGGGVDWVYVGQEGPYYTKSEIDTDFALKSELPVIATTSQVGLVKPDGQTTIIQQDGTLSVSSNVAASLPLFTAIWADHILNNASYLRSDTFSWQSGAVYISAYNHLANDIDGVTAETETVAGTTITFYRATDGHKIVLPDQETNADAIFTATGTAWYYILDTDNTRFKLPRVDAQREQLLQSTPVVGNGIALGLNNGTSDYTTYWQNANPWHLTTSLRGVGASVGTDVGYQNDGIANISLGVSQDAAKSGLIAKFDNSTSVFSGKLYLYFYVGNTIQNQTEIDVGEITEDLNGKADIDLGNLSNTGKITSAHLAMPSDTRESLVLGVSGTSYTAPADGYFNFRGKATVNGQFAYIGDESPFNHCGFQGDASINNYVVFTLSVKKGQTVVINYTLGADLSLNFIYAEGAKTEAN